MSPLGLRVGPFEIVEEAHVPAIGSWYRARRAGLSRREPRSVLVRLLGPQPSSRDLGQVQRQFEVLRTLDDHRFPRAVALYEGSGALALQAPHTAPLSRVVEARLLDDVAMTPATLIDLSLDLIEALQAAHQRGHCHGHLSAENIALAHDGSLWIWGLGLEGERPPFSWLPPERARGDRPTEATDQWSLGALLVALVSGHCPWSSSSASADPRSGDLGDFIEPVSVQWPALGRLVRRMLDPNPAQRFPSLHPVRLELLALARRAGGVSDRRDLAAWLHHTWSLENGLHDLAPHQALIDEEPGEGAVPIAILDDEDSEEVVASPPAPRPHRAAEQTGAHPIRVKAPEAEVKPDFTTPSAAAQVQASIPVEVEAELMEEDFEEILTEFIDEGATEMAEHAALTEMAEHAAPTEMAGTVERTGDIPPVRSRIGPADQTEPRAPQRAVAPRPIAIQLTDEQPAALPDSDPRPLAPSEPPAWREDPAPTMPGMEAPEPVALRLEPGAPSVEVELDDDEDLDQAESVEADFFGGVDLDELDIEVLHDEDKSGPIWDSRPAATSIQPFTDPHFSAAIADDSPVPATERRLGPRSRVPDDTDGPTLISGARPLPWEQEQALDLPEPANTPIVRIAPWAASAAMVGLVLLTVVNVVRLW